MVVCLGLFIAIHPFSCQNSLSVTAAPILALRLLEKLSHLTSPVTEPPATKLRWMNVISWYWFRLSTILWRGLPWARESGAIHWVYVPKVQIRVTVVLSGKPTERSTLDACPVSWRLHLVSQVINWNFLIGKCWDKLSLTLTTYRLASMYRAWLALNGVRVLNLELLRPLMFPIQFVSC